jgi:hypothetical protein
MEGLHLMTSSLWLSGITGTPSVNDSTTAVPVRRNLFVLDEISFGFVHKLICCVLYDE